MGKLLAILKWTGIGAFLVFSATLVFFSLPFTGWKALSVQTGSMEPKIPTGSLVFVQSVPPDSLQPGDVLTYKSADRPETITHRVVEKQGNENGPKQYVTKGDANQSPDPLVNQNQVVGKVTNTLPGAGKALDFIKTPLGLTLSVYIPAAILFIYEIRLLVKRLAKLEVEKHKKEAAAAAAPPAPEQAPTPANDTEIAEKPAPKRIVVQSEPVKRPRPRMLDGLSVLLVGVLVVSTVGTTQAALFGTATLTGNTISATAPTAPPSPQVLIWRVNFPGAPDADVSFQPMYRQLRRL